MGHQVSLHQTTYLKILVIENSICLYASMQPKKMWRKEEYQRNWKVLYSNSRVILRHMIFGNMAFMPSNVVIIYQITVCKINYQVLILLSLIIITTWDLKLTSMQFENKVKQKPWKWARYLSRVSGTCATWLLLKTIWLRLQSRIQTWKTKSTKLFFECPFNIIIILHHHYL